MLQRVIYAAAVLLALQLGLAVFLQVRSSSELNAAPPDALFVSFDPAKITAVQISATDGKKVTLTKSGKSWLLPEVFSAPADGGQLEALLRKVAEAKQGLAVASTKGAAKRFKTADKDFLRHIVFKEGDKAVADFYLGNSAGLRQSYARLAGKDEVVSLPISDFEAEVEADKWLNKGLAQLNQNDLKKVELADIVLTKKDKDWLLEGAAAGEASKEEINKALERITGLAVQGVVDPAQAEPLFKQPSATQFTATRNDGSKLTYALVKQADHYVLKTSASPLYLKIGSWQADELAKLKRADLLVKKEEKQAAANNPAGAAPVATQPEQQAIPPVPQSAQEPVKTEAAQ
ncbi:DUF4340 domain-containing protein [Candidatus Electronema sp. PJ]|uniref:DUF4340 domain-containing protein n=1 Tax=Candidatus Electronema sp. PJ TaxID=3401572 RepID=UPI003AA93E47